MNYKKTFKSITTWAVLNILADYQWYDPKNFSRHSFHNMYIFYNKARCCNLTSCKENIFLHGLQQRCFCTSEDGTTIFGQMWRSEAEGMTCGKKKPVLNLNVIHFVECHYFINPSIHFPRFLNRDVMLLGHNGNVRVDNRHKRTIKRIDKIINL